MVYHMLNGDVLSEKFPEGIAGTRIVMREAFMDGPVSESFDKAYWAQRMQFVTEAFDTDAAEYWTKFGSQLVMMREIGDGDDVYLWFEDDLFCQVNMWFVISIINSLSIKKKVFAVYTSHLDKTSKLFWNG